MFAGKIGAAVVAARCGGPVRVFDTINHFFLVSQMIMPRYQYWNFAYGTLPGEVREDEEGIANICVLDHKIAWLCEALVGSMKDFPKVSPAPEDVK